MRVSRALLVGLVLLVVAARLAGTVLRGQRRAFQARQSAPAVYATVPSFHLVDQAGRPISREQLDGRVWVADFIFTRCAGQCPMMTSRMATLAKSLKPDDPVALVSFTVDPEHDSPTVLAGYAQRAGAVSSRWHFVTGEKRELIRLCRDGFHLAFEEEGGSLAEPLVHSSRLVLVDQRHQIRGSYDATDEPEMQRLQTDLRRLLREPS